MKPLNINVFLCQVSQNKAWSTSLLSSTWRQRRPGRMRTSTHFAKVIGRSAMTGVRKKKSEQLLSCLDEVNESHDIQQSAAATSTALPSSNTRYQIILITFTFRWAPTMVWVLLVWLLLLLGFLGFFFNSDKEWNKMPNPPKRQVFIILLIKVMCNSGTSLPWQMWIDRFDWLRLSHKGLCHSKVSVLFVF